MHITSHFIGIKIDSLAFADLFIELQDYIYKNGIHKVIELQNLLSVHMTLYYLDAIVPEADKKHLIHDLSNIQVDGIKLSGLIAKYFGGPGSEKVCYIGCDRNEMLESINAHFIQQYNYGHISENQLIFTPHISIFRIHDTEKFSDHRSQIDGIIARFIHSIDAQALMSGAALYAVNSNYHPEIQIKIS